MTKKSKTNKRIVLRKKKYVGGAPPMSETNTSANINNTSNINSLNLSSLNENIAKLNNEIVRSGNYGDNANTSGNVNSGRNTTTETYYNTLNLQDKIKSIENQGYYPVGLDIIGFIKKMMSGLNSGNNNANIKGESYFKTIGEYVDEDYNTVVTNVIGRRDRDSDKLLLPERQLNKASKFNNIIAESKKYTHNEMEDIVTPNGLLKMCRLLHKYKKNEEQWFRVASLLRVMYDYLSDNGSIGINEFFQSRTRVELSTLYEVEELWKTVHIFMTPTEMAEFKASVEFFKFVPQQ